MLQLSKNFSREEFACRCGCGYDTVDAELIAVLENIRAEFGAEVRILSGTRCNDHNAEIDHSSLSSQHLWGKAADIEVRGVPAAKLQNYLLHKYEDRYGLGCYATFTHIDVREGPARWER